MHKLFERRMHKQFKIGLPVHVCINYIICIDSLDIHPAGPDTGDPNYRCQGSRAARELSFCITVCASGLHTGRDDMKLLSCESLNL